MVSSFAINQLKADSVVDTDLVDSLYVYCDVVKSCVLGDSQVPLLRIVPAERDNDQLVTWVYENMHYVRLQWKSFQTIELNIRDRAGNVVPFKQGTLNVTLHFRQCKRLYIVGMEGRGMPVYSGAPYQRGYGLRGTMKNILRQATPLLKHAGRQALRTGISVVAKGIMNPKKKQRSRKKKWRMSPRKLVSPFTATRKRRMAVWGFKMGVVPHYCWRSSQRLYWLKWLIKLCMASAQLNVIRK